MECYSKVQSGEVNILGTATQLPDIDCRVVYVRAAPGNAGNLFLGGVGVTAANGTADATSGVTLEPGDWSPALEVTNLNILWCIAASANDDLEYLAMG